MRIGPENPDRASCRQTLNSNRARLFPKLFHASSPARTGLRARADRAVAEVLAPTVAPAPGADRHQRRQAVTRNPPSRRMAPARSRSPTIIAAMSAGGIRNTAALRSR